MTFVELGKKLKQVQKQAETAEQRGQILEAKLRALGLELIKLTSILEGTRQLFFLKHKETKLYYSLSLTIKITAIMYWPTLSGRTKLKLTVRQGNRPEAIVKALSFINVS